MQSDQSRGMVEAFKYVRDVYRNCARMLLSCDPSMRDRGFSCFYWKTLYGFGSDINFPDNWLHDYLIRQYYPVQGKEGENQIFTIAAIPWRRENPDSFEPLCLASRFSATETPDDVYWISVLQMHEQRILPDGKVHVLGDDLECLKKDSQKLERFKNLIREGKVASLAVPLLEITNTNQLFNRVVDPVLAHAWPLRTESVQVQELTK